ncbi:hypothetical protein GCM10011317_45870 [Niveispirillum cyanobacteriorum]|nr:hypothetical protein GCM10011317_45870 [Niveispirillum cyanobacteriorum]
MPRDDLRHDARGNRKGAGGRTWRYDSRNTLTGANAPGMAAAFDFTSMAGTPGNKGVTTL